MCDETQVPFPFVICEENTFHIAEAVFGLLDFEDLIKCREVCRIWRRFVDSRTALWTCPIDDRYNHYQNISLLFHLWWMPNTVSKGFALPSRRFKWHPTKNSGKLICCIEFRFFSKFYWTDFLDINNTILISLRKKPDSDYNCCVLKWEDIVSSGCQG